MAHDTFEEDYELANGGNFHISQAQAAEWHAKLVDAEKEIAALRAAAEKARNRWIGYETALEEIIKLEKSLGTAFSWAELRAFKESTRKIALAALEEVLK